MKATAGALRGVDGVEVKSGISMQLQTIFYGVLKQDVGEKIQTIDLDRESLTVGELKTLLVERYPALAAHMDTVAFAVGDELVGPEHGIQHGDKVALLPPVSGG